MFLMMSMQLIDLEIFIFKDTAPRWRGSKLPWYVSFHKNKNLTFIHPFPWVFHMLWAGNSNHNIFNIHNEYKLFLYSPVVSKSSVISASFPYSWVRYLNNSKVKVRCSPEFKGQSQNFQNLGKSDEKVMYSNFLNPQSFWAIR